MYRLSPLAWPQLPKRSDLQWPQAGAAENCASISAIASLPEPLPASADASADRCTSVRSPNCSRKPLKSCAFMASYLGCESLGVGSLNIKADQSQLIFLIFNQYNSPVRQHRSITPHHLHTPAGDDRLIGCHQRHF